MFGRFRAEDRPKLLAIGVGTALAVAAGFRLFWFLTDDAYIAFRYVSNAQLGRGYVWNPPPFLPVEGYTSWLWVALLDRVWSWGGVEPPVAANWLSLAFGCATLGLVVAFVARLELPPALGRYRVALLALVLAGSVTNRTFLAWLSSGLETALFNCSFTWWLYEALAPPPDAGARGDLRLALAATIAALTRPDGLVLVAGTLAIVGWHALRAPAGRRAGALAAALPLLGVALHLVWRRSTYGDWLPNTYYAKVTGPWPASGWRYLASFVLEYGLALWLVVAGLALWLWLRRARRARWEVWVAGAVVLAHLAYYVLIVGGDHFEYRVLSHLVPLVFVSLAWLAGRLALGARGGLAVVGLALLVSWPIPWLHWWDSRGRVTRRDTLHLILPVAGHFPPGLRAYAQAFDDLQRWLISRSVCMRHQEHRAFQRHLIEHLPSRDEGRRVAWDQPNGRPVLIASNVGVVAWILPNVAIIDTLGLNDYVVARTPAPVWSGERRQMAHERRAPAAYEQCFRPNFLLHLSRFDPPQILRRDVLRERPLTDADIRRCEERFRAALVD